MIRRFFVVLPVFLILPVLLLAACSTITVTREAAAFPENTVLFTFDDGPNASEDTTARLLEVLDRYEIKAMFALLGENADAHPELVRAIARKGHSIINHGYSGRFAVNMTREKFLKNLDRGEEAIRAALQGEDLSPRLYRPQGGFYRKKQQELWEVRGYRMVPVTARAYDAALPKKTRAKIIKTILDRIEQQRGGIILLHDARDSHVKMEKALAKKPDGPFNRSWIPETVEELILTLRDRGYVQSGFDMIQILYPKE